MEVGKEQALLRCKAVMYRLVLPLESASFGYPYVVPQND